MSGFRRVIQSVMGLVTGDLLNGRYRIGAELGAGGAATVFVANLEPSGRECVVKLLRADSPEVLSAFRDEFAVLARLSHRCLLPVLDFGSALVGGVTLHYYVAERLHGVTLAERARQAPPTSALLAPLLDALEGLAALHAHGLRHGDFTPFNVMVDERGHGTLIDLGCAQPLGAAPTISGTPGFLAPELLERGFGDVRADLYAVGRTLERVFELCRRPAPERVERVIKRLTRPNPVDRPGDVGEVLEAFQRTPRAFARYVAPTSLLGRESQLQALADWLAALKVDAKAPRVLAVQGVAGSGVTRLTRELTWRAQLELPVQCALWREDSSVARALARAAGLTEPVRGLNELLAVVERLRSAPQSQVLVVEDAARLEAGQLELLQALARVVGSNGRFGLVVSGLDLPRELVQIVRAEPLTLPDVRAWVGQALPESRVPQLLAQTGGLPKRLEAALRERSGPGDRAQAQRGGRALALPKLGRAARGVLALLSASALTALEPPVDRDDVAELLAAGLVERDGPAVYLSAEGHASVEAGMLTARELSQAHVRLAELASSAARGSVADAIFHWSMAGELDRAERLYEDNAEALWRQASRCWRRLEPLWERSRSPRLLLGGARLLLAAGRARQAINVAVRAARLDASLHVAAVVCVAECLGRLGRAARAQRLLTRLLERAAPDVAVLDRLARTLLSRGDYAGARDVAQRGLAMPEGASSGPLLEAHGLALGYLGELELARHQLSRAKDELERASQTTMPERDRFRVTAQAATLAFRAGQVADALADYRAALEIAERNELDDLLAMGLLNLGVAEQQAGLWGSALRRYERGSFFARATARTDSEVTLDFNLCNLYAEVGAFDRAHDAATRLRGRVEGLGLAHLVLGLSLVEVEVALGRGDLPRARRLLPAMASEGEPSTGREPLEITLRYADVLFAEGKLAEADDLLSRALQRGGRNGGELVLALQLAQGRLRAAQGRPDAIAQLTAVLAVAQRGGLGALEACALSDLFEASEKLGAFDDARAYRERARRSWERVAADLPAGLGEAFWRHPRRRRLNEVSQTLAPSTVGGALLSEQTAEIKAYRRLISLTRRLSSSTSVAHVLEYTVQAAVELTNAERGFLLLKDEGERLEARVAASSEPFAGDRGPSRSIVRRSLEHEESVLTTDALEDPRFASQRSIHSLRLKSVLCVPVLSASGTLGALYVDSTLQRNQFRPADRELLLAFADQVAIALGNARLHEQLEARTRALEQKNLELANVARGHAQEAERLREQFARRLEPTLRYQYPQIVGASRAMQRLFERLDRVTDADVNLLIQGESGTGKELVARAVHENGARRDGPFVGINCAALPEALLESELFGHVRGAFTGADRDKLGLLQAARGGTLFLDEVGELPPAVQSKLLRVLQEREVRPVGALSSEPLDVRVLAATHRDMAAEVARGSFREDLYYRLAVVTVEVPSLRERLEDLPALSARILEDLATRARRKPPTLAPDALRKLAAHEFRGNVRELQNILTRAFVLGASERVRAEDIELAATAGPGAPERGGHSATRREFQSRERARILEALERTRWNVSAVSAALGIPRASLHRKLKRYGLERSGG